MNPRERFHAVMNFLPFDRLPLVEWAVWWDKTIDRWSAEGLPVTDRYAVNRHFGQDVYMQDWVGIRRPGFPNPSGEGRSLVEDMDGYERIRPYLFPRPAIDRAMWEDWAQQQKRGEVVLWFSVDGFFWFPRTLLGIERHLYAFYDQPELMHRINNDLSAWILYVVEEICDICTPDFMTFGEDLSYNHGPMLSKAQFNEFLKPYYGRVVPALNERGILSVVDSDGDVTIPSYWFEDAGLDGILPLERQAGADIARLRAEHPRMRFIGHYDKMVMTRGEAAMRAEFERLLPTASGGGFIISVDHQTPPGVSLHEYELYMRLFREYAAEAGRLCSER
ncbi:MAG TPA: uroporphyrinogen decarboxylase family protein [Armatimonadota bacterium]